MLVLKWKERAFMKKWTPDVFVDFRRPYWWTKTVHRLWRLIQSSTKVHETFRQITQKAVGHKDLKLGQIVYILVFNNISFSWLLALDGFQFIFLLRDSENEARPGLFREWLKTMVSKTLAWPSQINKKANIHNIHEGCMLDKQYS